MSYKKYYAVLDTNVIVSAMISKNTNSIPFQILNQALSGKIIPLIDNRILEEYNDVLHRNKFKLSNEKINFFIGELIKRSIYVNATPIDEFFIDKDDIIFYEVAMETQDKNSYLVTGNLKHYPIRPFVVTPRQMLDIIENE